MQEAALLVGFHHRHVDRRRQLACTTPTRPSAASTAMVMMLLGEVAPGGVGTGLYGILLFAVVTVFIAGLMVGRTPEFLGKRIGAREVKLALLGTLIMPVGFLVIGRHRVDPRPGARRTAQLRAARLLRDPLRLRVGVEQQRLGVRRADRRRRNFYDGMLGVAMAIGRFAVIVPVLALAGSLAAQRTRPIDQASMPTQLADLRRPAGRRDPDRRRPLLLPRPGARPAGRGPHLEALVMRTEPKLLDGRDRPPRAARRRCGSSTRASCCATRSSSPSRSSRCSSPASWSSTWSRAAPTPRSSSRSRSGSG